MEEVDLLVLIEVIPGKRNEQLEAHEELKPLVLAEPGCMQYKLFGDTSNENKFILVEKWASQEALDAHDQTEHMMAADAHSPAFRTKPATVIQMRAITA